MLLLVTYKRENRPLDSELGFRHLLVWLYPGLAQRTDLKGPQNGSEKGRSHLEWALWEYPLYIYMYIYIYIYIHIYSIAIFGMIREPLRNINGKYSGFHTRSLLVSSWGCFWGLQASEL